jgi:hypothetical protein
MPTPTYIALATVTLGSTDSEVVFSSIPATYRDLVLVAVHTSNTGGADTGIRFNSDTGSNYSMVRMTSAPASASATQSYAYSGDNNPDRRTVITQIMDYAQTDKHKTLLTRYAGFNDTTMAIAARWANTNAITTVSIFPSGGSWTSGSTFSLYGVA